jgi:hypothetical protein
MNADDVLAVLGAGRKIDIVLLEVQLAGSIDGSGLRDRFAKTIQTWM